MKKATAILFLTIACSALMVAPTSAAGFSLFGSYIDLDEPDGALGLGLRLDARLSENWTLDFSITYHEAADVVLDTDLVAVTVTEEINFIPFDLGVRYHFGDSDGIRPYLGGGLSALEIDTRVGEGDALIGGYGVFGANFGDDIGPKFFIEGTYRVYDDVELELFEELASDNLDEFAVDGFSAALGIRWGF